MSRAAQAVPHGQRHDAVYESVGALVDAINGPCRVESNKARQLGYETTRGRARLDWHGIKPDAKRGEGAVDCMLRLLAEGWTRGVELMEQVASAVEVPAPQSVRRRAFWLADGDEVDQQRVWAGALDSAWRRTKRASGAGPQRVRVLVDSIASGGEDSDTMRWRGVAALVLADALVGAGYTVQVESVFKGSSEGIDYTPRCIVKAYGTPLDVSALAATTACPGFFRALWHDWHYIAAPEEIDGCGYMVGRAEAADFPIDGDTATAYMAGQRIQSAAHAGDWVRETVAAIEAQRAGGEP